MDNATVEPASPHELISKCFILFSNDYYNSFIPGITDLVKLSRNREYYQSPAKHLGLQLGLLERIAELDQATFEGKQAARASNDEDKEDLLLQRKRNKVLSFAMRQIADGIAWRSVGFSRFTIRVVSQAHSPGSTQGKEVGRKKEIAYALNAVGNRNFVLIHDATNYLRVGDLSLLKEISGTPFLGEVKNKKGIATAIDIGERLEESKPITKQESRLLQAQIMLSSRQWKINGQRLNVSEIMPTKKDYLASLNAVLKQAMNKGAYGRSVSPYIYIEAFDVRKLVTEFKDAKTLETLLDALPSPSTELIGIYSNYDAIQTLLDNEVVRSGPPHSIFPLSAEVTAKVMTGQMVFRVMILRKELEQEFLKYGYEFSLDEQALDIAVKADHGDELSGRILFPDKINEGYMHIRHVQSRFVFPVHTFIASMAYELLSVTYVVSIAEAARKTMNNKNSAEIIYPEPLDAYRWL